VPELIETGKTGFVVEDIEGMIDAVQSVSGISRAACREHALENFSVERMAAEYEEIYKKILSPKSE
jgi:glycosyltransferase involved in cell wall biosynthesis